MQKVQIVFKIKNGEAVIAEGVVGQSLLQLAHEHAVPLEGACEGNMACSTCHVILREADYLQLPEPSMDEEDMLDLALGVTATSRLACQITLSPTMNGMEIDVPSEQNNMLGF